MTVRQVLLGALVLCAITFVTRWTVTLRARRADSSGGRGVPGLLDVAIGFVTSFLDTLGIGSFATTTAIFRLRGQPPDELIPGTLIVGLSPGVAIQALVFISAVTVDPAQLGWLIAVATVGGWIGAGVVSSLSRRAVQIGMGCALLSAAAFMLVGMAGLFPTGGAALAFTPSAFIVALAINFGLGALLTLGIGNYAPSLVAFSLLGIDPRAAFPIMMGSGAFVALVAGTRFVGRGRFHLRSALGLAFGGVPGVLVAVWLVTSLPLTALRWLIVTVVLYAGVTLLRAARAASRSTPLERASA